MTNPEARETKHWLRMIVTAEKRLRDQARPLWQEAKELWPHLLCHLQKGKVTPIRHSSLLFDSSFAHSSFVIGCHTLRRSAVE